MTSANKLAAKKPPAKGTMWSASELKWVDNPAIKGAQQAVLWGDPTKGAYGALKKVPGGTVLPMHSHTNLTRVVMVAGTILWNLASAAGTIGSVESFFKQIGFFESFTFQGGTIFRACLLGGLILVIAGSALNVLLTVLFNLISDVVGGIRVTVLEEDTARAVADG